MPTFSIETNLPRSKIPRDFVSKTVPIIAKLVDKPIELTVVMVTSDVDMSWGGSSDPCGMARLAALSNLSPEENLAHSKFLSELIEKELGIPADRMYISFMPGNTGYVGYKGTTFATFWK